MDFPFFGSVRYNISTIQRTRAKRGWKWVFGIVILTDYGAPAKHVHFLREIIISYIDETS